MEKKILLVLLLINLIISILARFFFNKFWFLVTNFIVFFLFLISYIFIVKRSVYFERNLVRTFLFIIFFWASANLIAASLGYNFVKFGSYMRKISTLSTNISISDGNTQKNFPEKLKPIIKGIIYELPQFTRKTLPIFGARIILKDINEKIVLYDTFSNKDGLFNFELNDPQMSKTYKLYVLHPDYEVYFTTIDLLSGFSYEYEVFLVPKKVKKEINLD